MTELENDRRKDEVESKEMLVGFSLIPAIVRELSDDDAIIAMVDAKRIQFTVAVEISYITPQIQQWIYKYIRENGPIKQKQIAALREYTQLESITQRRLIQLFNDTQVGARPAVKVTLSEKYLETPVGFWRYME